MAIEFGRDGKCATSPGSDSTSGAMPRTFAEVERRLRDLFPELWEQYERLRAARRALVSLPTSRPRVGSA